MERLLTEAMRLMAELEGYLNEEGVYLDEESSIAKRLELWTRDAGMATAIYRLSRPPSALSGTAEGEGT